MAKNFAHRLGVTQERIEQIGEMVDQTFYTGFGVMKETEKTTGNYETAFDGITKLLQEDVKLLNGVEEGIVYGYRIAQLIQDFSESIKHDSVFGADVVKVVNLTELIEMLKNEKKRK